MNKKSVTLSLVLLIIAGCLITYDMIRTGGLWLHDYTAFAPYDFPTEADWEEILGQHTSEIQDGPTDLHSLNKSFVGGWNRCIDVFVADYFPWRYAEVKQHRPSFLAGNMDDTDRVAGNAGWKAASSAIESQLTEQRPESVRSQIRHINPRVWWMAMIVFAFVFTLAYRMRN